MDCKVGRVKILSDGTPQGTYLMCGDMQLPFVKSIKVDITLTGCKAIVELFNVELEIEEIDSEIHSTIVVANT